MSTRAFLPPPSLHVPSPSIRCSATITSPRPTSPYEVLGIPSGSSGTEIKAAYRKLARSCHPDVDRRKSSAEEFIRVQTAYSTLSDPEKKQRYDRTFRRSASFAAGSGGGYASFDGLKRRTWETDQCW